MKKIYALLLSAFVGVSAAHAELQFYMGKTAIENGSTVAFSTVEDDPFTGGPMLDPKLSLHSDKAENSITLKISSEVDIQCCASGNCKIDKEFSYTKLEVSPDKPLDLRLEYIGKKGEKVPTFSVSVEAQKGYSSSTKRSFVINLGPDASGITEVNGDGSLVTCNGNNLQYNLSAPAVITIYTAAGTEVKKANVDGEGTLSFDDLENGVYLYSVTGSVKASGKFIRR